MKSPFWKAPCCVVVAVLLSASAMAQDSGSDGRLFGGIGWARFDLNGDFDDSIILGSSEQIVNVPAVLEADGVNFSLGVAKNRGGFSFFHFRSSPQTVSMLGDQDSRLRLYGLDGYWLPLARKDRAARLTPIIRGGAALVSFTIENSATDGVRLDDANFRGFDLSLGGGLQLALGKRGHLTAEIEKRVMMFTTVDGIGDRIDIETEDAPVSSPTFFKIGVAIYLKGAA